MPWKETRVVDKRLEFIEELKKDPRCNFAQLCRAFGISRNNGYKWLARYKADGEAGLANAKPVPRTCPHKTPDAIVDRVLALRKERPHDGPKKLYAVLVEREPELVVPAPSTIGEILKRYGYVRPRRARLRVPPSASPLAHAQEPNDVWCVDFKGNFALGDGSRCYPLTITDATTRYLVKCEGLVAQTEELTRRQFELAFREFGLPVRIRSDNGAPFAAKTLGGLSSLSVWWIRLGIAPERIEPGQPQQNGRHERFHLTLKQQTASPPSATAVDQQRAFDLFRHDYNDVRPHEALGQTPPGRHYEPSWRVMPEKLPCPEYGDGFAVRWVHDRDGTISWGGRLLKLTRVLGGQPVGLKQVDEDEWEIFYGTLHLGYVVKEKGETKVEPIS